MHVIIDIYDLENDPCNRINIMNRLSFLKAELPKQPSKYLLYENHTLTAIENIKPIPDKIIIDSKTSWGVVEKYLN